MSEPTKYSWEDLESAQEISRAYRRQFALSRLQLAVMLDTDPKCIQDIENCRDPGSDKAMSAVFTLAEELDERA